MVPFAGYQMPVQYPNGILHEHKQTRSSAGLFDVSHMGQIILRGDDIAGQLEKILPTDVRGLKQGETKYSMLLNDKGGIIDDLMVTCRSDNYFLVVNAGRKHEDLAFLHANLKADIEYLEDRSLIALQGPKAAAILGGFNPIIHTMKFMSGQKVDIMGVACFVTRSGYTGEDGFEISVPNQKIEEVAKVLLMEKGVEPVGLGARDSLRLEAGLCLYGHDIDETTTPIEANLNWVISKRRRTEGGFNGDAIILGQMKDGTARRRVGIQPLDRAPAREGTEIQNAAGENIGVITSGGFGPTVDRPIAMGYVRPDHAAIGTHLKLVVRGRLLEAQVTSLPFVEHRYFRG